MLEKELSFADLSISLSELYEAMGYADAVPDEAVEKEVRGVLGRVEAVTSPRFCFFISGGELDESKDSLSVGDTCFSIGKIITRQLRGSLKRCKHFGRHNGGNRIGRIMKTVDIIEYQSQYNDNH